MGLLKRQLSSVDEPSSSLTQLLDLHRNLLRLQAVAEEIGEQRIEESEQLWKLAGQLMPGPIPGADRMLSQIDAQIETNNRSDAANSLSDVVTSSQIYQLSLLKRYITVMRDLTLSLRHTLVTLLQFEAPDIADSLSQLWRVKVSLKRTLSSMKQGNLGPVAQQILSNEEYLGYIEASRTLEARALLQVIDADAREVAQDFGTGLTVFGELARNADDLKMTIISVRRDLGRFIKAKWPEQAIA